MSYIPIDMFNPLGVMLQTSLYVRSLEDLVVFIREA